MGHPQAEFRLIQNKKNSGQLASILNGIRQTTVDLVSLVDADDMLLPDSLKIHAALHSRTNVGVSTGAGFQINENDNVIGAAPMTIQLKNLLAQGKHETINDPLSTIYQFRPDKAQTLDFIWSPTSSCVIRSTIIRLLDWPDEFLDLWRICADRFLFTLSHVTGGTAWIEKNLFCYRLHGRNKHAERNIIGFDKYHSPVTDQINKRNKRILAKSLYFLFNHNKDTLKDTFAPKDLMRIEYFLAKANLKQVLDIKLKKKVLAYLIRAANFILIGNWKPN